MRSRNKRPKTCGCPSGREKGYGSRGYISASEGFLEGALKKKDTARGDAGGVGQIMIGELLEHHHFGHRIASEPPISVQCLRLPMPNAVTASGERVPSSSLLAPEARRTGAILSTSLSNVSPFACDHLELRRSSYIPDLDFHHLAFPLLGHLSAQFTFSLSAAHLLVSPLEA